MAVCESFAINFKHLVFGGTSNSWISRSSFSDDIAHLQVYSRTQMKNTMCDILAYQGRVAGSLILFWLRLPHPALPMTLPWGSNVWVLQQVNTIHFWKQLLSGRQFIDCLNWWWHNRIDRLTTRTCTGRCHWCQKRLCASESLWPTFVSCQCVWMFCVVSSVSDFSSEGFLHPNGLHWVLCL